MSVGAAILAALIKADLRVLKTGRAFFLRLQESVDNALPPLLAYWNCIQITVF